MSISYTSKAWDRWEERKANGEDMSILRAKPLQKILTTWYDWGFSCNSVATATTVSQATLDNIRNGRSTHVTREVYREISMIDYRDIFKTAPDKGVVASFASIRKVHALNRIGWSNKELGEMLVQIGGPQGLPDHVSSMKKRSIMAKNHRYVDWLFQELQMLPGTNTSAASQATKKGYPSPLAWDDIDSYHDRPQGMIQ